VFLVVQALIGLAVLLQFNRFAVLTGVASLIIVAVYPFMKRITWWPQIVLGLAFSWGALMGFAATFGRIDLTALALYAGSIAWVIGYDTILCASGRRGRRADRHQIDRAVVRRAHAAGADGVLRIGGRLIGMALARCRRAMAGVDRPCRVRRASGLANHPAGDFGSGVVPADLQIQPRCGATLVRGIARGCGDAGSLVQGLGQAKAQSGAMISRSP